MAVELVAEIDGPQRRFGVPFYGWKGCKMSLTDAGCAASIAALQARVAAHDAATHLLIQQAREAGATTNAAIAECVNAHGGRTS